jgi:ABC-type molybdate transport system substrate-binding protein
VTASRTFAGPGDLRPAAADVAVLAAGSLRAPFSDLAHDFERVSGHRVALTFGPSGLLRERITSGEGADVFASANMEHPQALATLGWAQRVDRLVRNQMCLLTGPNVDATSDTALGAMLDPAVKVGTSTPKADPSGDYAWEVFRKAEALRPGAFATLSAKALLLVGGPTTPPPPERGTPYGILISRGAADVFLTYRTNAESARKEFPQLRVVPLPEPLAVGADYGIALRDGAPSSAREFVAFLLWTESQRVLSSYGFGPP